MSDPVTNIEIEDVLSSIRRLVANGKQARAAAASSSLTDTPPEERLVLTPAHRVDDTTRVADHDSFVWKDMIDDAVAERPAVLAEPEPAADSIAAADSAAAADGITTADSSPMPAEMAPETGALFQSRRTTRDAPIEAGPAEETAPTGLEAKAAEFEAAVARRQDQWEPDGVSDEALAGRPVPALDWHDVEEETETAATAAPERALPEWTSSTTRRARHPQPDRTETAAPEEAQTPPDTGQSDAGQPDTGQPDTGQPDTARPDAAADAAPGLSLDESILDEESLRDLVAEIVREELQGALGERITRNVRKLVRREIHRALTSQDFD